MRSRSSLSLLCWLFLLPSALPGAGGALPARLREVAARVEANADAHALQPGTRERDGAAVAGFKAGTAFIGESAADGVMLEPAGRRLGLRIDASAASATADGATLSFESALPDVDLSVWTDGRSINELLTIGNAPGVIDFTFDGGGVSPNLVDGAVRFAAPANGGWRDAGWLEVSAPRVATAGASARWEVHGPTLRLHVESAKGSPVNVGFEIRERGALRMDKPERVIPIGSDAVLLFGSDGSIELFERGTNAFRAIARPRFDRQEAAAVRFNDGRVLFVGGGGESAASAELYDPRTGAFSRPIALIQPRRNASAVLLGTSLVLVTGGDAGGSATDAAELFDLATMAFIEIAPMTVPRASHAAALLDDGRILVTGGRSGAGLLASAEIFEPLSGGFFAIDGTGEAHERHAIVPADGGALVVDAERGRTFVFDAKALAFNDGGAIAPRKGAWSLAVRGTSAFIGGGSVEPGLIETFDLRTGTVTGRRTIESARAQSFVALIEDGAVVSGQGAEPAAATAAPPRDVVSNAACNIAVTFVDYTTACPIVRITARATDVNGARIPNLTTGNFSVYEDGIAQQISVTPITSGSSTRYFAIAIDSSGSLTSADFISEKNAAKSLIGLLGPSDQVAVYGFASFVTFLSDLTSDKQASYVAIDGYGFGTSGTQTALYDGIYESILRVSSSPGGRAVVVMTDGINNNSFYTQSQVIALAQQNGVAVFTIGFGSANATVLSTIASQTGGEYYSSVTAAGLQDIVQSVGTTINTEYEITYTTTKRDGTQRNLEVQLLQPGCTASAFTTHRANCPCTPAAIVQHPAAQTIAAGSSATLSVVVSGTAPFTYQWYSYVNGAVTAIPNSNSSSITVSPTVDTGYYVRVTNSCSVTPATSNLITITVISTVCTPPTITQQPQSTTISAGQSATLTVIATGTQPLTYEWYQYLNGVISLIQGATGNSITVSPAQTTQYYVRVIGCGPPVATSNLVTVSVITGCNTPPVITQQPAQTTTINAGQSVTLSVIASGGPGLLYQWYQYLNGTVTAIPGATGSSITVTPPQTTEYYVRITCGSNSATSNLVAVIVCSGPPVIVSQPISQFVRSGQTVTLSVVASGPAPLFYQWYSYNGVSSTAVPNSNSPNLTVSPTSSISYWVVVTSPFCGSATSNLATLTVCTAPFIQQHPQNASIPLGASTTLSVVAFGTSPLTYRWYSLPVGSSTSTPINGSATSITVAPTVNTDYYLYVVDPCGQQVISNTARVTVICNAPVITSQSTSRIIGSGQSTTLSVSVSGTGPFSYTWYSFNGVTVTLIPGATTSSITVSPSSTLSYYVVVHGPCPGAPPATSALITVTVCDPPTLTSSQPANQTIPYGGTAVLSVNPGGTGPFSYTWYSSVPGSNTTTTLATNSNTIAVSPLVSTNYWVRIYNCNGEIVSRAALVTVLCDPAVITTNPGNYTITAGQSATLSVTATGTNLTYQWYSLVGNTTTLLQGATSSSITVSPSVTTSYFVRVTAACGATAVSGLGVVTICIPPQVVQQPQGGTIQYGQNIGIAVSATGSTPLTLQWFATEGNVTTAIPGNATSISVGPRVTTDYWVRVTNACGTVVSNIARVMVICNIPVITQQPAGATLNSGGSTLLQVTATGTATLAYQWGTVSGGVFTAIPGATSASYLAVPSQPTTYQCRVSNPCGTTASATAFVDVCDPPVITQNPPATVNAAYGQAVTLSVGVGGSTPRSFQWYYTTGAGTQLVPNGTGSSITHVPPGPVTDYWCLIVNRCGQIYSSTTRVRVTCSTPTYATQPAGGTILKFQNHTMSVSMNGNGPFTYQWFSYTTAAPTPAAIPGAVSSSLTVSPGERTNYFVRARDFCGNEVASSIATVIVCSPPVVLQQPIGGTINAGQSVTMTVSADGTLPFNYQWYAYDGVNSTPVGTNSASLTVSPTQTTDYFVWITNCGGQVVSSVARINVTCALPVITQQPPANVTIPTGGSTTLSLSAVGCTPMTIQWYSYVNNASTLIPGATGSSVTVSPASATSYFARITNPVGVTVTNLSNVFVCDAPVVTQSAASRTIYQGVSTQLSVTATGSGLSYQWYSYANGSSTLIPGNSPSITVSPSITTQYYVWVYGQCGAPAISSTTVVTVLPCNGPTITSGPAPASIQAGGSATLTVTATGTAPLSYHWYSFNGVTTTLIHVGGPSLNVSPSVTTDYFVRIYGPCNNETISPLVRVTVGGAELLVNGGFENGASNPTPWVASSGIIDTSGTLPPHSGGWKAWLNGYGVAHTDTLHQTFTIPGGVSAATLSLYLRIVTEEPATVPADTFLVQVRTAGGSILATLGSFTNLHSSADYVHYSFDLTPYKGQSVMLYFAGFEDSARRTSFLLDDVSVTSQ